MPRLMLPSMLLPVLCLVRCGLLCIFLGMLLSSLWPRALLRFRRLRVLRRSIRPFVLLCGLGLLALLVGLALRGLLRCLGMRMLLVSSRLRVLLRGLWLPMLLRNSWLPMLLRGSRLSVLLCIGLGLRFPLSLGLLVRFRLLMLPGLGLRLLLLPGLGLELVHAGVQLPLDSAIEAFNEILSFVALALGTPSEALACVLGAVVRRLILALMRASQPHRPHVRVADPLYLLRGLDGRTRQGARLSLIRLLPALVRCPQSVRPIGQGRGLRLGLEAVEQLLDTPGLVLCTLKTVCKGAELAERALGALHRQFVRRRRLPNLGGWSCCCLRRLGWHVHSPLVFCAGRNHEQQNQGCQGCLHRCHTSAAPPLCPRVQKA
mmetsp:Transcript_109527/g.353491  ORF Transcript_109527/g.353491 Transcript_109527/m.353491 type:complete len:375 (-) Transcript_109527:7-1131(-)